MLFPALVSSEYADKVGDCVVVSALLTSFINIIRCVANGSIDVIGSLLIVSGLGI